MNTIWGFSASQTALLRSSFDAVLALGSGSHVGTAASLEWAAGAECSFNITTSDGQLFDKRHVPSVPILFVLSAFKRATSLVREGEPLVAAITDEKRIHVFQREERVGAYDFDEGQAIKATRSEWTSAWKMLESEVLAFLRAEVPNLARDRSFGAWVRGEGELPSLLEPERWVPSLDGPPPGCLG